MVNLGTLPGTARSIAQGINNAGVVVGVSLNGPGLLYDVSAWRAIIVYPGSVMQDLNDLIPAN